MPHAYQVRRSEFDEILIRNAARKGANVIEGCRVRDVEFLPNDEGAIVRAEHDDGRSETWQCRFLIDASGRDTFLGNRFKAKQRNPKHNSSALYGHFTGAQRHDGQEGGPHHHLLVRARLVLVHPARRRHHQRRRGDLAVLPEDPQETGAGLLPGPHRPVPGPGGAAEGRRTGLGGGGHRQLFLCLRPHPRHQLPAAGRCLRLHRSGLLVRRHAGHEQRLRRRRCGRYLPAPTGQGGARRSSISTG